MHHVKDSVKEYSRIIATGLFLRIHRSFIVSKLKIRSFNKQEIILDDGFALPIGRQYAAEISNILS